MTVDRTGKEGRRQSNGLILVLMKYFGRNILKRQTRLLKHPGTVALPSRSVFLFPSGDFVLQLFLWFSFRRFGKQDIKVIGQPFQGIGERIILPFHQVIDRCLSGDLLAFVATEYPFVFIDPELVRPANGTSPEKVLTRTVLTQSGKLTDHFGQFIRSTV